MTVRIESWDWRQQPNIDSLTRSLADLGVYLHLIDTGLDDFTVVLSSEPFTYDEAYAAWEADCVAVDAQIEALANRAGEIADAAIPGK